MKRLLACLLCVVLSLAMLTACQAPVESTAETTTQSTPDNDNGNDITPPNENDDGESTEPEVYGYWYSAAADVAMDIIKGSNAVKFYSLSAGYYEYYAVADATYTYDQAEETLILTLNEKDYTFTFDPYEDRLALDTTVYVRKDALPTEHPSYTFPKYGEMELSDVLTLPNYKELDIRDIALSEARMQIFEDHHSSGFTTAIEITDRPAQFGDLVVIDYVGKKNGVAFEGGTAEAQQVKILYNSGYIPGFAEGIIGHSVGESFEVAVTFPENYSATELAGADVIFEMTLSTIYDVRLTDEQFATYLNLPYETYDEWVEATAMELAGDLMLTMLYDECVVNGELPGETYLYFYQSYLDQAHYFADYYGMTYEDFCKYYGDYESEFLEKAQMYAKYYIIYYVIAEAEGLTWTEEEYNTVFSEFVDDLVTDYGYSQEDAALYVTNNQQDNVYAEVVGRIVTNYLAELVMGNAEAL